MIRNVNANTCLLMNTARMNNVDVFSVNKVAMNSGLVNNVKMNNASWVFFDSYNFIV